MLYLISCFDKLISQPRTLINKRPGKAGASKKVPIEVDDHSQLLICLPGKVVGMIEAYRVTQDTTDDLDIEIHGTQGAMRFEVKDPNWLYVNNTRDTKKILGRLSWFQTSSDQE